MRINKLFTVCRSHVVSIPCFVLSVCIVASASTGAVISETFDSGYDATNFNLDNSDPDSTFGVSGGQLAFHGTTPVSGMGTERGGWFMSNFTLVGDFDASVDLTTFNAPFAGGGNFVVARMVLWYADNGNFYGEFGRLRGQARNADIVDIHLVDQSGTEINTSATSGSIRWVRSGSALSGYWNGQLIGTNTVPLVPFTIGLLSERWGSVPSYDVAYDNFVIAGVPEPATLCIVTPFGFLLLRRHSRRS